MKTEVLFPELLEKTKSGDPEDYKNLAYKHYDKDKKSLLAFEWFMRAAEKGDAEAQYRIGDMYFFGNGKQKNLGKAAEWSLKALENGFGDALLTLAWMYEDGYDFSHTNIEFKSAESCYNEAIHRYDIKGAQKFLDKLRNQTFQAEPDIDPAKHLESLIGLRVIKQQINHIEKRVTFDQRRIAVGLDNPQQTHHFIFAGNPGSGKTEVARILGKLYKKMGILKSGHVIEVDRGDLVAGKVGQTAPKTKEAIEKALDGVLFIDEAHMLWDGHRTDFGLEAISTLVKYMEDYRERLIVILAGYPEPMKILLRTNAGLKSRIKHHLTFEDYSAEELKDIYEKFVNDNNFMLHDDAEEAVIKLMKKAIKLTDKDLGNGRFVRNAFDKTIERMAIRTVQNDVEDKEGLQTILFTDIPDLDELLERKKAVTNSKDNVISIND